MDKSSEMPLSVAKWCADSWAWQRLLTTGHSWLVPFSPLSPATTPPPATQIWEECLFSFVRTVCICSLQFFRQDIDSVSLNSVTRFSPFWGLRPPCHLAIWPVNRLHIRCRSWCPTSHGSTRRSHWNPWLHTWPCDIGQVSVCLGVLLGFQYLVCLRRALCAPCPCNVTSWGWGGWKAGHRLFCLLLFPPDVFLNKRFPSSF